MGQEMVAKAEPVESHVPENACASTGGISAMHRGPPRRVTTISFARFTCSIGLKRYWRLSRHRIMLMVFRSSSPAQAVACDAPPIPLHRPRVHRGSMVVRTSQDSRLL